MKLAIWALHSLRWLRARCCRPTWEGTTLERRLLTTTLYRVR